MRTVASDVEPCARVSAPRVVVSEQVAPPTGSRQEVLIVACVLEACRTVGSACGLGNPTKFRAHLAGWARCRLRGSHLAKEPSWTRLTFLGAAETRRARVGACYARDWRRCALLAIPPWQAGRACHLAQVSLETASLAVGARAQVWLVAVGASRTLLRAFGPLLAIVTLTRTGAPSGSQSSLPR
eukprot:scaffold72363_cov60-Phaeocystis_antarctica.AAC.6